MMAVIIYIPVCLCLVFLLVLIGFINKLWWTPIRIQSQMRSQGIKGPSYKFFHGSTKEILNMKKEIMKLPMELSHQIFPRVAPHVYSWIKLYGTNFLMWHGHVARIVVAEPELIKEILNDKDRAYPKIAPREFAKKLLGDGLVTAQGEKWFKQRKLATHAFHAENLKSMIPDMIASVEMMLKKWRDYEGKEIDVYHEFKVFTSEVISRTAFGSSYLEGENIFNMLTKLTFFISKNEHKVRIPLIGTLLKTRDDIESDKLEQDIRDSIIKILKKRESSVMTREIESYGNDLLGILMKAYHNVDKTQKISLDDVIDECKTFYIAGHETTASLIPWTVLLLATHSEWQDKARKEVLELFGQQSPSGDNISRLKIMNMIINESLRLYPPVVLIPRKVKREVKLGKFLMPADVDIIIPTLAAHLDPQIWGEDVHLFKPERFAGGVAKATSNNMAAFIPFGLGPRTCVGLNFAITETKIALSMILQRYKLTLSPNYVHSPVIILTLRPQHGLQVMLHAL